MGYYVGMEMSGIIIPANKVDACLAAINALFSDENLESKAGAGTYGGSITKDSPVRERKHYSWVNTPKEDGFKDLKEAFNEWRYEGNFDKKGNFTVECFEGEKLGDDEILFDTIAPFVDGGKECGLITVHGEEDDKWRYVFENGGIREETGTIIWE